MNDKIEIKPQVISPLKKICMTIGELPTSYLETMTYYEMLVWFTNYLRDTIIPVVNNNGEAVTELQQLFVELQTYVNNYFDNLDVQEEINNKLDEMVTSGALQQIVDTYFNQVTTMVNELKESTQNALNLQDSKINGLKESTQNTLNLQDSKINGLTGSFPIFVENISDMTQNDKIYVLTTNNHIYQYNSLTSTFVDTGAIYSENQNVIKVYPSIIRSSNYENLLPDANNISENIVYQLLFAKNSEDGSYTANLPEKPNDTINTLISQITDDYTTYTQIYISGTGKLYKRYYINHKWYNWESLDIFNTITLVNKNNYLKVLPDVNDINENCSYNLLFASDSSDYPLNLPEKPNDRINLIQTFITKVDNSYTPPIPESKSQIYYSYSGSIYYRFYYNNKWYDWINIARSDDNSNLKIYVGTDQEYTKLKDAIEYATQFKNSIINILDGTYNIIDEFGNDFFENYTNESSVGLILKNGVKLIFSANTKVVCNYTGTNQIVKRRFSPFNTGKNGCTIENLTLESSGTRYAIHDERGQSSDNYINNFINCDIKHEANGGLIPCIGGGLGKNGIINIKNCIFNSVSASPTYKTVSYHNNNSPTDTNSKSLINITNCYFTKGTFYLTWCGVSTLISKCLFTNNRIQSSPQVLAEREGIDNVNNVELYSYNNSIQNI